MRNAMRYAMTGALVALLAAPALAQSMTSGVYSKSFGNSTFGGELTAVGSLYRDPNRCQAYGYVLGEITLLGHTFEAAKASGLSKTTDGESSNRAEVYFGGDLYYSRDRSYSWNWNWSTSIDLVSYSQWFAIGIVPIQVKASAGVGATANLDVGVGSGIALSGYARGYAYGEAAAYVNLLVARAGIEAELDFFNQKFTAAMTASLTGYDGTCTYQRNAISLSVRLVADYWDAWTWSWERIGSLSIINYSSGSHTTTLLDV